MEKSELFCVSMVGYYWSASQIKITFGLFILFLFDRNVGIEMSVMLPWILLELWNLRFQMKVTVQKRERMSSGVLTIKWNIVANALEGVSLGNFFIYIIRLRVVDIFIWFSAIQCKIGFITGYWMKIKTFDIMCYKKIYQINDSTPISSEYPHFI